MPWPVPRGDDRRRKTDLTQRRSDATHPAWCCARVLDHVLPHVIFARDAMVFDFGCASAWGLSIDNRQLTTVFPLVHYGWSLIPARS
jgi:hypothetical protein